MVIGIDAREVQNFPTGIGRYFVGLVKGIRHMRQETGAKGMRFVLFVNEENPLIGGEYSENWEVRVVRARPKSFLQQFLFPLEVWLSFGSDGERILLTNPFGFTFFCPLPQALIILDLIYKYFPQEASFKAKLYDAVLGKLAARRANVIFTCSESSKRDITKFLGIPGEKVVVITLGIPSGMCGVGDGKWENVLKKYGIEKPFILYVGNMREHKNLRKLLEAFAGIRGQETSNREFNGLSLVIVGSDVERRKPNAKILKQVQDDDIRALGSVPDEDLAMLYRQAEMLVQPSLYEGFGMSVLEAMACGCPVVASRVSSIPEVGGDVPVYINPEDPEDIARGITEVLGYNKTERERVVKRGFVQARKFNWEKMAELTLKSLVANSNE